MSVPPTATPLMWRLVLINPPQVPMDELSVVILILVTVTILSLRGSQPVHRWGQRVRGT